MSEKSDLNFSDAFQDVIMNDFSFTFTEDLNLITSSIQEEEETKDFFTYIPDNFIPVDPIGPPQRCNFPGNGNFAVEINGAQTLKKKYLYSHKLNRIYVNLESNFSVDFNWNKVVFGNQPMYVRATTVFSEVDQAEERVERCHQHSHKSVNGDNVDKKIVMNVLRSARELGSQDVFYCGNPEKHDSWYSVVVRLSAPSGHAYKFMCKNSCPAGINRRATSIIFTLEDQMGAVQGRTSVGVRVCSCPRRDLSRDEAGAAAAGAERRKRPLRPPPTPAPHKRRAEHAPAACLLPQLSIVNVRIAVTGLKVMLSMSEQARDLKIANNQPVDDLESSITNIISAIADLENNIKNETN